MRDFIARWGYGFKEMLDMPREQFCMIHGNRFLDMSYSQFRRTLKRETPYVNNMNRDVLVEEPRWKEDRLVNRVEHKSVQSGVWDEINVFI